MKVTTIPVPKPDVSITMSHEDATYLLMLCGRVGGTPRNPVRKMTNALSDALREKAGQTLARLLVSGSAIQCTDTTSGFACGLS